MRALVVTIALLAIVPAATAGLGLTDPALPVLAPEDAQVYPTWPVLTAELEAYTMRHPDITRLHSAGKSTAGMDLWLVEIADFTNADAVPLEGREVVWIDGGTHANEYSGVMFVMRLLYFLTEGYGVNEDATWIVENRHTYIMPLLNPEGSMNGIGRLNDNLVNINRNFPIGWGALDEGAFMNNPGPSAASEPETQVAIKWWDATRPDYMASIHCCGNLWLYPYGIEGIDPHEDDAPMFARVCDEAYPEVREDCGPIWSTIYPASGSSVDTAYESFGATAFGFEMSGREAVLLWGLPFTTTPAEETESESWRGIMHAFANVHLYGAYPELAVVGATTDAITFRVTNVGFANLTHGHIATVDSTGTARETPLPRLASEESAEVTVSGVFASGELPVELTYLKRALAREGVRHHVLALTEGPGGLVATLDGRLEDATTTSTPDALTPLPATLAILALVFVGLATRRRT